jgi:hypothetical protein
VPSLLAPGFTAMVPETWGAGEACGLSRGLGRWQNAPRGVQAVVIAPPPGDLFFETNDNSLSVAILLSYGTRRACRRSQGEEGGETAQGLSRFETTKQPELGFRALLTGGASKVELALVV